MSSNGNHTEDPAWHSQPMLVCRGVRGAISVEANTREAILNATGELLRALVQANGMRSEDIASAFFTTTADLTAEYPAVAARLELGWTDVALMCGQEMNVTGSMPRCIRVLIHWNTTKSGRDLKHIYLRDAIALRPDRQSHRSAVDSASETSRQVAPLQRED